jgi:putative transposase
MRSFVFPQLGVNPVQNQAVKLPKIGLVKLHQSRTIPDGATIKQARIVRRVSGWYVMLTLQWDVSVPTLMPHGEGIGIDVGLTNFLATSNGLLVKRQRFFKDAERKLKLLQQRVCRKKLGSNNWRKAQKKVAKLHEYVANSRKDWHRKLSHQICQNVGMIFVEDLNLIGHSWAMGKHCLDASWGQFFTIKRANLFEIWRVLSKGKRS